MKIPDDIALALASVYAQIRAEREKCDRADYGVVLVAEEACVPVVLLKGVFDRLSIAAQGRLLEAAREEYGDDQE